jgi:hypothetical protein
MNAGFSNLASLKEWLLTEALRTSTDYDSQILAIGLGVAGIFETHCNRKFARQVGATYEFRAELDRIVIDRAPVEQITKIELRDPFGADWVDQGTVSALLDYLNEEAGLVALLTPLGTYRGRGRITFDGGFWWNQQEPDYDPPVTPTEEDPDLSAQPEGSNALPDNLKLAWLLQCEHVWQQRDKLGLAIAKSPTTDSAIARTEILPLVKEQLQPFVRYAML